MHKDEIYNRFRDIVIIRLFMIAIEDLPPGCVGNPEEAATNAYIYDARFHARVDRFVGDLVGSIGE